GELRQLLVGRDGFVPVRRVGEDQVYGRVGEVGEDVAEVTGADLWGELAFTDAADELNQPRVNLLGIPRVFSLPMQPVGELVGVERVGVVCDPLEHVVGGTDDACDLAGVEPVVCQEAPHHCGRL